MILDFDSFQINESSLKKLKRDIHGVLNMSARKRMRKELRDNIITFKFRKRNGELRTAHGTLHPDYLPKLKGGAPRPERQMVYFDLDKNSWRSFRSYSFIKIVNIKPVEPGSAPVKSHTKPSPKPVSKKEEEEETKKVSVEKEEKKPIHSEKEEKEEKKSTYKSPIYDESEEEEKERKEDDKKVEKLKHKDKDEEPEKEEKKKDEDE